MGQLSDAEVAGAVKWAGFTGERAVVAVAVALAESGGNTEAVNHNTNGTTDRGLWQINSVHKTISEDCAFSVFCSTRQAFLMSGGGRNWRPWVAYTSGRYRALLSRARVAVANPKDAPSKLQESGPLIDVNNPVAGAIGSLQDIGRFFGTLLDPSTWVRTIQVIGGGALMIVGLYVLVSDTKVGKETKKAAVVAATKGAK